MRRELCGKQGSTVRRFLMSMRGSFVPIQAMRRAMCVHAFKATRPRFEPQPESLPGPADGSGAEIAMPGSHTYTLIAWDHSNLSLLRVDYGDNEIQRHRDQNLGHARVTAVSSAESYIQSVRRNESISLRAAGPGLVTTAEIG